MGNLHEYSHAANTIVDTSGQICPWPLIHTKQAISHLKNKEKVLIITTDPSFLLDCQVFIRQTGHRLLQSWKKTEKWYYLLEKS